MKVIVHYPSTELNAQELAKRIARIHAEAAVQYIEKLSCSKEQKEKLLNVIIQEKKKVIAEYREEK